MFWLYSRVLFLSADAAGSCSHLPPSAFQARPSLSCTSLVSWPEAVTFWTSLWLFFNTSHPSVFRQIQYSNNYQTEKKVNSTLIKAHTMLLSGSFRHHLSFWSTIRCFIQNKQTKRLTSDVSSSHFFSGLLYLWWIAFAWYYDNAWVCVTLLSTQKLSERRLISHCHGATHVHSAHCILSNVFFWTLVHLHFRAFIDDKMHPSTWRAWVNRQQIQRKKSLVQSKHFPPCPTSPRVRATKVLVTTISMTNLRYIHKWSK